MQLVAVDIGNSSIKIAVEHSAHDDRWSWETIIRGDDPIQWHRGDLDLTPQPAFWSVSSVNKKREQRLASWVSQYRPQDRFHLIGSREVDLETDVVSREKLGRDRLIAAWQAIQLNDTGPVVVIDAGTAVTIDVVDEQSCFLGGVIFPGAVTMLKLLAQQTDALPDLAGEGQTVFGSREDLDFIGKSTNDAIQFGVYQTQVCTMIAAVKTLSKQFQQSPEIFVTGGGIVELLKWLPSEWEHVPDLVLQGTQGIGRRLLS